MARTIVTTPPSEYLSKPTTQPIEPMLKRCEKTKYIEYKKERMRKKEIERERQEYLI